MYVRAEWISGKAGHKKPASLPLAPTRAGISR